MNFIVRILISSLAVLIASYLLPGITITGNQLVTALLVAIVLAFLNSIIKPLLTLLTIPITVMTLGLFLLVINAFIILFTEKLVPEFHVRDFWSALWFSLVLSLTTSVLELFNKPSEKDKD